MRPAWSAGRPVRRNTGDTGGPASTAATRTRSATGSSPRIRTARAELGIGTTTGAAPASGTVMTTDVNTREQGGEQQPKVAALAVLVKARRSRPSTPA